MQIVRNLVPPLLPCDTRLTYTHVAASFLSLHFETFC